PGAKFIHAAVDLSVSDIVSPTYVPLVVQSFFDHDRAINYDGHTRPLLSIQVTELVDGVFIGCSMNHAIGDGTSFWHFFNTLSEIFQAQGDTNLKISRPPVLEKWFPEGHGPLLNLPFTNQDELISRFEAPELLERIFHFSAKSIAKLKERANTESNTTKISSFQSLSAFVWRSITKARRFPNETLVNYLNMVSVGLLGNYTKLWLTIQINKCVVSSMVGLIHLSFTRLLSFLTHKV
ncbi:hypothetical protein Goklo_005561, partial [Gossypium klotzschianum]|nr:hypothetical protein [Gossypium klotzschianum]